MIGEQNEKRGNGKRNRMRNQERKGKQNEFKRGLIMKNEGEKRTEDK